MTRIADVQAAVARHYGLSLADIKGPCRLREIAYPRQMAMYLSKRHTGREKTVIGREFKRDHSTIIYGIRAVRGRLGDHETLHRLITIRGVLKG